MNKIIDAWMLVNTSILWLTSAAGAAFWYAMYYPILRNSNA